MTPRWRRALHRFCLAAYFDRCRCRNADRLPAAGPALYLGLHRNGAVDGLAYRRFLPGATFLVSRQLTRSALSRVFFDGIAVARDAREGDRSGNREALRACLRLLREGGELFVFPEGTSSLGPAHLPFKPGAAAILADWLAEGGSRDLPVVPLAIEYPDPARFRSDVEVVVGARVALPDPAGLAREALVPLLQERIAAALEAVGVNVATEGEQAALQSLAGIRCADGSGSPHAVRKAFERGIDRPIADALDAFERQARTRGLARLSGTAPFPPRPLRSALAALALAPPVLLAAAANAPPLAAGWLAGRRLADGPNVVSLWRLLAGIPALLLWVATVAAAAALAGAARLLPAYAALTLLGLCAYAPWRAAVLSTYNLLRWPEGRRGYLALHRALLGRIP